MCHRTPAKGGLRVILGVYQELAMYEADEVEVV